MHSLQNETYSSLETALYFAIKGEEILNHLCTEKFDSKKSVSCQTEEVETLLEDWRVQKNICEKIAKTLYRLNPEFTHKSFHPATTDGKGVCYLKTFSERKQEGTLIVKFSNE